MSMEMNDLQNAESRQKYKNKFVDNIFGDS